jgi:hypothetical protein
MPSCEAKQLGKRFASQTARKGSLVSPKAVPSAGEWANPGRARPDPFCRGRAELGRDGRRAIPAFCFDGSRRCS